MNALPCWKKAFYALRCFIAAEAQPHDPQVSLALGRGLKVENRPHVAHLVFERELLGCLGHAQREHFLGLKGQHLVLDRPRVSQ